VTFNPAGSGSGDNVGTGGQGLLGGLLGGLVGGLLGGNDGTSQPGGQGLLGGTGQPGGQGILGGLLGGNANSLPGDNSGSQTPHGKSDPGSNQAPLILSPQTFSTANVPASPGTPFLNPNSILFLGPLVQNELPADQAPTEPLPSAPGQPLDGLQPSGVFSPGPVLNSGGDGQDTLFDPVVPFAPDPVTPSKIGVAEPVAPPQEGGASPEMTPVPEGAGLLTDFHPNTLGQLTAGLDRLFAQFGEPSQNMSHWLGGLSPMLIGMALASAAVEIARRRQQARAGLREDHKEMGSPWYPLGNTAA